MIKPLSDIIAAGDYTTAIICVGGYWSYRVDRRDWTHYSPCRFLTRDEARHALENAIDKLKKEERK